MLDLLQIIAEPRRQEILRLVWDTERAAGEIADKIDVTFGAVSQHLRILHEAGLVTMRRRGRYRIYRARQEQLGPLAEHLTAMWRSKLSRLKQLAEAAERRHVKQ